MALLAAMEATAEEFLRGDEYTEESRIERKNSPCAAGSSLPGCPSRLSLSVF